MSNSNSSEATKEQEMAGISESGNSTPTALSASQPPQNDNEATLADFDPSFNPANPNNEFHCFSKLPKELRNMIWLEARPPPRVIHLNVWYSDRKPFLSRFEANQSPAILQVNRESRTEAMRFYEGIQQEEGPPICYVDLSHDYFLVTDYLLLIDYLNLMWTPAEKGLKEDKLRWIDRIDNLVMDVDTWGWHDQQHYNIFDQLSRFFPNLKEITSIELGHFSEWWNNRFNNPPKLWLVPCSEQEIRFHCGGSGTDMVQEFAQRQSSFPDVELPTLKFADLWYEDEGESKAAAESCEYLRR